MLRAWKISVSLPEFSSLERSWRVLALPLLCLLLFFGAHVSQAATINVSSTCSLPNAITSANGDSATGGCTAGSGADTINLSGMSSPYTLSAALPSITSDITITGAGKTVSGNDAYRIFRVNSGGNLKLNNITLRNGKASGFGIGGALLVGASGSATVTDSTISNSAAYQGGAVGTWSTLTIINSTIRNSSAHSTSGDGGALYIHGGTTTLQKSAIHGNSTHQGGGIYIITGTLTVENSFIYGNRSNGGNGAAILQAGGTVTLAHSTLWNNQATGSGAGNGIYVSGTANLYLRNSILESTLSSMHDCQLSGGGASAVKQNVGTIIGSGSHTACQRSAVGTASANLSAPAFMPPATSGALGVGNATQCAAYAQDKNGVTRPATFCDAGAVERVGATESLNYIDVDATCSLASAVVSAQNNNSTGGCAAGLADAVATDYIRLRQDVSLTGSTAGLSSKLVVDGLGKTVSVAAGATGVRHFVSAGGDLTLRNITLSGGNASQGGAIHSSGTLTMEDCVVKNSSASLEGGAIHIWDANSDTTIDRCAFINNRSDSNGGAINIALGELTVSNSTFIGNSCASNGCAIYVGGAKVDLAHNTFWNNVSDSSGNITAVRGGGTTQLLNSILGRDSALGGKLCGGTFQNPTDERGLIMWNGPTQNDPCGKVTVADPRLGAQTGFPDYLPLGAGSSARGKGLQATCAAYPVDQRSAARPDRGCDSGAVQYYSSRQGNAAASGQAGVRGSTGTAVCTGEWLNANSGIRVSATYDFCSGINFERRDIAAIGIQWIIDAGPLDVVDVWGWVRPTAEVCFPQPGSMLFLNASKVQRVVEPLPSYRDGQYTCAQIGVAGTLILMPADSPHTTPPSAGPQTPLAGCMARTNYILNLRAAPGGDVITLLPYDVTLTAYAKAAGWYEVDYHGIRGWVSGDYVTLVGACA